MVRGHGSRAPCVSPSLRRGHLLQRRQVLERRHLGQKELSVAARIGGEQHLPAVGRKTGVDVQVLDVPAAAMDTQHPRSLKLRPVEAAQQHVGRQAALRPSATISSGVLEWKWLESCGNGTSMRLVLS